MFIADATGPSRPEETKMVLNDLALADEMFDELVLPRSVSNYEPREQF